MNFPARMFALSRPATGLVLGLIGAAGAPALAQTGYSESIVVTGEDESAGQGAFETRHGLAANEVAQIDAATADDVLRRLPGVYVPTNSRGEAIAFVRNAGERQVAIFFEGADINVPWDNRLDLSLIPAGLIGSVRSAAGPLAPHYGVNALGALSISAPGGAGSGLGGTLSYATGDALNMALRAPLGPVTIGAGYSRRDGMALSDEANLPYAQGGDNLRTNTDRELVHVFARTHAQLGAHALSFTAFHVEGAKGIAPESKQASGSRFWRYPDVAHTLVALNLVSEFTEATHLTSSAWYQRFGQTIDSYTDETYAQKESRQIDADRTLGLRELLRHEAGPLAFVGSFNFLQSTHRQRDFDYDDGVAPGQLPDALVYRQRNYSLGGEVELAFANDFEFEIGAGYDVVDYVRTGDKPAVPAAEGWTGRAGLAYEATDGVLLRGAVGRKIRAPTMRERFGEGINRFLENPGLRPEKILTAELGLELHRETYALYAIPFYQDLTDTIDQQRVDGLRQRINLSGSRVKGLEFGASWSPGGPFGIEASGTWTQVRKDDSDEGAINRIAEKPALLARVAAHYALEGGPALHVEALHTGRAWSADEDGELVALPRSTQFNGKISFPIEIAGQDTNLFVRVDNITDTLVEPQLGLPAPGRSVMVGIDVL